MKILILSSEFPPERGGIGTYARELAQAAAEDGHAVTVVAPDYGADQSALDATLPFEVLRYEGGQHSMRDLPRKLALVRKLAKTRPDFDIVHACDWPFYLPLALSAYRGRTKAFLTFHGTEVQFMRSPKRALLLRLVGFWNGWAKCIGNSRYTAKLLSDAFTLPLSDIRAIPLGVSAAWFQPTAPRAEVRARRDLDGRFVIASLGRLVPRKGHLVLAEALAKLPPDMASQIDWLIVGPATDKAYAEKLAAATAALPTRTRLLGSLEQEQVRDVLAGADLFVLPGFIDETGAVEGFGLVYLEAAALGLASIGSASGGVPDAILDNETGLLTPPNDAEAVAEAIIRLFNDRDLLARLSANALANAQRSTWRDVMRRTYETA